MRFKVYESDCVEFMRGLEDNTVDAIVTDPPYGLEFMGKEWDRLGAPNGFRRKENAADVGRDSVFGRTSHTSPEYAAGSQMQEWHFAWATEALRVLKPGGHLLAFGGSRTYHRLTCAIEDAGFEIRDCITWQYLSGFPKSLNVSKAIDKAAGAEREVVGVSKRHGGGVAFAEGAGGFNTDKGCVTAPATDAARQWDGWGTALKPSQEPIVVARKPLVGTVAKNVEQWGTGALNIDDCRVQTIDKLSISKADPFHREDGNQMWNKTSSGAIERNQSPLGRWPPNTVMSHDPTCVAVGETHVRGTGHWRETRGAGSSRAGASGHVGQSDLTEKYDEGVEGVEVVWACVPGCPVRHLDNQTGVRTSGTGGSRCFPRFDWAAELVDPFLPSFYAAKAAVSEREAGLVGDGRLNLHPTVKPIGLMRWLVRLVTPPGGIVFDPFTGSGTTGCAAVSEGFDFLGVEKDPAYVEIAVQRIEHWAKRAI
ncbi:MAG: Modification methylase HindIII [Nitrospira sp.]|nr:Modification methylase HindIII [Nitrospira sp.]